MDGATILDITILIALAIICLASVLMTIVRLPGPWLILLAAVAYAWLTGWDRVRPWLIIALLASALIGEIVEFGLSAVTVRHAGASARAGWGALIGGFAGMFVFSLPMPFVGTMFGALVGCFVGALIGEYTVKPEWFHGARVGTFSAIGFVLGIVTKIALSMVMSIALLGVATYGSFQDATQAKPLSQKPAAEQPGSTEQPEEVGI